MHQVFELYPPASGKCETRKEQPRQEEEGLPGPEESEIPSAVAHWRNLARFASSSSSSIFALTKLQRAVEVSRKKSDS